VGTATGYTQPTRIAKGSTMSTEFESSNAVVQMQHAVAGCYELAMPRHKTFDRLALIGPFICGV